MIHVTRLDGSHLIINDDLIVTIEPTPDTVLTLTTGARVIVQEDADDVVTRVVEFRRRVMATGPEVREPSPPSPTVGAEEARVQET
jgi:flagellar protein FlbD